MDHGFLTKVPLKPCIGNLAAAADVIESSLPELGILNLNNLAKLSDRRNHAAIVDAAY